jgi:hypothetical protein
MRPVAKPNRARMLKAVGQETQGFRVIRIKRTKRRGVNQKIPGKKPYHKKKRLNYYIIKNRGIRITQICLKQRFYYDPDTGIFTRKPRNEQNVPWWWNARWANKPAGCVTTDGAVHIKIDGKLYFAHQLAWFYMTGSWVILIDHRDGNPANNCWKNPRKANFYQNSQNAKMSIKNNSGYKGVSEQSPGNNRWRATINVNGTRIHLGYFNKKEDASKAYQRAAHKFFGEFARIQ